MRASEKALESAHAYLLEVLISEIEEFRQGKIIDPRSGEAKRVPPALLSELGRLLKGNGIDRPQKDVVRDEDDVLLAEFEALGEDNISPFRGGAVAPLKPALKQIPDLSSEEKAQVKHNDAELRLSRIVEANCSNCKQLRPRAEFARNRSRSTGLQSICKPCAKIIRKHAKAKKAAEANIQFQKENK